VLRFLSADWLRAFDAALRSAPGLGDRFAANPITIAQEVVSEPGSVTRYVIVLDASGGRIETAAGAAAGDVTFACDYGTAVELASGTLNAQRALTSGRLKVRGTVDRLAAAGSTLAGLDDLLAPLRADTEF
jgi:SCP-2 sterol transfer family